MSCFLRCDVWPIELSKLFHSLKYNRNLQFSLMKCFFICKAHIVSVCNWILHHSIAYWGFVPPRSNVIVVRLRVGLTLQMQVTSHSKATETLLRHSRRGAEAMALRWRFAIFVWVIVIFLCYTKLFTLCVMSLSWNLELVSNKVFLLFK